MGKFTDIDKALFQGATDAVIGIPLGGEGLRFDKPGPGLPWAFVYIMPSPGGMHGATCGIEGEDEHVGIMQIDVNFPLNQGVGESRLKIDEIAGFFTLGKHLVSGVADVTIRSASRVRGREVDGWWRTSLSIEWTARVPRVVP